jgi:hypothetical protein
MAGFLFAGVKEHPSEGRPLGGPPCEARLSEVLPSDHLGSFLGRHLSDARLPEVRPN